ncbi:hypothetical protein Sjap_014531 [Stephania japonica]|uniref:Metal-nicotianamine transporter YSL7 n=1 Tax=Stephania japonica TaxID=461633 RepID=A0AAP0NRJ7_9MAGN
MSANLERDEWGGYASYILGMTKKVAAQADAGNTPINTKTLNLGWMIGFVLVVSFVGLFSILPLRRWFFTAADGCGFASFPTFGLQAFKYNFYFDFSSTYVGVGMICPYIINLSMLLGSVISWGIMWPLIEKKQGDWYTAGGMRGLQGYKVFVAIAMILGDGLYHFVAVFAKTSISLIKNLRENRDGSMTDPLSLENESLSYDDKRRIKYFTQDQIPMSVALGGYALLAIISIITVPYIFTQLKWYHILVIYLVAPILAFCNSYGCGLTDWSLASNYGKIAIFVFGSWVGMEKGGVVAGLAACGVMMSIVSTASDLMQDFKTGYLTLASPRSMFCSQVIGTLMGCIISPVVFWVFFYKAYPTLGEPGSSFPAPFGLLYRGIALIGTEGTAALPKHCLEIALGFLLLAVLLNLLRDVLCHFKISAHKYVPSAMAMAIPFYLGGYFTIDMCVGSLIRFIWEKKDKKKAEAFVPAMASGLICGDSIWGLPAAVLSLAKVKPPICMKFLSRSANAKVDGFLGG